MTLRPGLAGRDTIGRPATQAVDLDIAIIATAFLLGFGAAAVRLPPLVGYLGAGFLLHAFGYETTPAIDAIADFGVLLLLFGIGLKLRLRTLARPEVWLGASVSMIGATALIGGLFIAVGAAGLPLASGLAPQEAILIGFALSFSSTVFAVKALETRNETSSIAGRIAIGILIVQDIFAVGFLTLSADSWPSPWALPAVAAVVAARPVYGWLLERAGHGELLTLFGLCLAIGVGGEVFDQVGLKADLGALVVGITLARHPRAAELAERLLGFKDILLIGFFLSIGLGGAPDAAALVVAVVALAMIPFKTVGYMLVLTRFRLRSRTSWHASVTLGNYSEFGLIVVAAAVERNLLAPDWTAALAVAVAASFALAAPANDARYSIFRVLAPALGRLERSPIQQDDAVIDPGDAKILVFGMGRVGTGAYDELIVRRVGAVLGVDRNDDTVEAHRVEGRRVVRGDALDLDFWDRLGLHPGIELIVLAMSDHQANLEAVDRIRRYLPSASIAASATYRDQLRSLEEAGVDTARNLYEEAGQGLADDACDLLEIARRRQRGLGAGSSTPDQPH